MYESILRFAEASEETLDVLGRQAVIAMQADIAIDPFFKTIVDILSKFCTSSPLMSSSTMLSKLHGTL